MSLNNLLNYDKKAFVTCSSVYLKAKKRHI